MTFAHYDHYLGNLDRSSSVESDVFTYTPRNALVLFRPHGPDQDFVIAFITIRRYDYENPHMTLNLILHDKDGRIVYIGDISDPKTKEAISTSLRFYTEINRDFPD